MSQRSRSLSRWCFCKFAIIFLLPVNVSLPKVCAILFALRSEGQSQQRDKAKKKTACKAKAKQKKVEPEAQHACKARAKPATQPKAKAKSKAACSKKAKAKAACSKAKATKKKELKQDPNNVYSRVYHLLRRRGKSKDEACLALSYHILNQSSAFLHCFRII